MSDELADFCPTCGYLLDSCKCEDVEVDTCLGCGRVTWAHRGVLAWDQKERGSIAPQLCPKCWKAQGYQMP